MLLGTLRVALGLGLLSAAAALVFATPAVELVYQRGSFGAGDTIRVASLLAIFALAVPGWVTQQVAVRSFFARDDTWRPMLMGTGVAIAAIPLYLALGPRMGAEGLAIAGVIGMSVNALLTLVWARRLHGAPRLRPLLATGLRAFAAAVLASAAAVWVMMARILERDPLGDLVVGGAAFGGVVVLCVLAFGDESLRSPFLSVLRRLRRR